MQRRNFLSLRSNPFDDLYIDYLDCYCFRLKENIPSLEIENNAVIFARQISPSVRDLVICEVPEQKGRVFIGEFIKRIGLRAIIKLPNGFPLIVLAKTLLVITSIE